MKIALAQINTTVGDIAGNLEKIAVFSRRAEAQGAELAVFPEQALAGYPALDLWEEPAFIRANQTALKILARRIRNMGVIVGHVAVNPGRSGKPIFNSAALLHQGKVKALRHKSLLPTYDVFDEARYFEPAQDNPPVVYRGRKLGISICEDAWADETLWPRRLYSVDPVRRQVRAGAEILINISSSPFVRGKVKTRVGLLGKHAKKHRRPLLYCNLVGGNDELIFDGQSLHIDASGRVAARAKAFEEDLVIADTDAKSSGAPAFLSDIEEVDKALQLGIRDYLGKCGFAKAVVGLSGGIDSAVVCALAVGALGRENVTGVSMPSVYSSEGSKTDAKALAYNFGIRFMTLPIAEILGTYQATLGPAPGLTEQNLQARIRGNLLMALSNKEGAMLLSTGNKSEMSVGYCTLYGDMSGGLAVLADVPKMTVYELAHRINRDRELIPQASIDKAPSAELKPDQRDQDDLPPYDVLDAVIKAYVEERKDLDQIVKKGFKRKLVADILSRIDRAEFKRRQAAPSLKISSKAWGVGRRMPIARASYR